MTSHRSLGTVSFRDQEHSPRYPAAGRHLEHDAVRGADDFCRDRIMYIPGNRDRPRGCCIGQMT